MTILNNDQWQEAIVSLANAGPSGGGTQYTDGAAPPANPIGTVPVFDNSGTWVDVGVDHPLPVSATVTANPPTDLTASGTISAAQAVINTGVSNATVVLALGTGQSAWKAQLKDGGGGFTSGTTIVADKSIDGGTTYFAASFKVAGASPATAQSSVVGPGPLELTGNAAGSTHVRIRCSVLNATETIAVRLNASQGVADVGLLSSIPAGTNKIGGVTIADGDAATFGTLADAAVTNPASSGSVVALLKGLLTRIGATFSFNAGVVDAGTQRVSLATDQKVPTKAASGDFADGAIAGIGTTTQTKATDGTVTSWSVIQLLKGLLDKVLSTLAVTQSGTWTVQPGNTQNTTAWLMAQISNGGAYAYTIKEVKNTAVTAGTGITIWTPTSGKKFWLLGWCLYPTGAGTAAILFQDVVSTVDSTKEFLRTPRLGSVNTTPSIHSLYPHGYLSSAANNVLFIDTSASVSVEGYVYGFEV